MEKKIIPGKKFEVEVDFITSNTVDINSEELRFTVMFSKDKEHKMLGLQLDEPLHSNQEKREEIECKLLEIARKFQELKELMS